MWNIRWFLAVLVPLFIGILISVPCVNVVCPNSEPSEYQESIIIQVRPSLGQISTWLRFSWQNIRSPPFNISCLNDPSFVSLRISVSGGAWVSVTLENIDVEEGRLIADSLCKGLEDILGESLFHTSSESRDSSVIYSYSADFCPVENIRDVFLDHKPSLGFGKIVTPSQVENAQSIYIALRKEGEGFFVWDVAAGCSFSTHPLRMEMNREYTFSLKDLTGYFGSIESSSIASKSELILRIHQRDADFSLVGIETTPSQMQIGSSRTNGYTIFFFTKDVTGSSVEDLAIRFTCVPPRFDLITAFAPIVAYIAALTVIALIPIVLLSLRRRGIRLRAAFSLKGFTVALIFLGLGLSIFLQGFSVTNYIAMGGDYILFSFTGLGSVLIMFFFGYVCIRWLRLHHVSWLRTNLEILIPLAFGLYALSNLVTFFNSILDHIQVAITYILPQGTFIVVDWLVSLGLFLVFGFSLLRLSSIALRRQAASWTNMHRLTVACLGSYGVRGTLNGVQAICATCTTALSTSQYNVDLLGLSRWVSTVGNLLGSVPILLLSIDVYKKKDFDKRSVYMTFFFVALGWLMQNIAYFNTSIQYLSTVGFPLVLYYVASTIQKTGVIAASLLTIIVSNSLIRGGRIAGRNFKLSLAAVFLYSVSSLLAGALTVFSSTSSLISQPWRIFSRGTSLATDLIGLSSNIPMLAIGLLLRRHYKHYLGIL